MTAASLPRPRIATHRAACDACDATVIVAPGAPEYITVSPVGLLDATATVSRGGRGVDILPLLPRTVAWECPACDTRNV